MSRSDESGDTGNEEETLRKYAGVQNKDNYHRNVFKKTEQVVPLTKIIRAE